VQNPKIEIAAVSFTAPVITRLAPRGEKSRTIQDTYHRALTKRHPETIEILKGDYLMKRHPPRYKTQWTAESRRVLETRGKETDVNIALHLYRDAMLAILSMHRVQMQRNIHIGLLFL